MTDATLQTVLLRDERSSLQATFVPGAGMLCASLRHGGEELLAQNAGIDAYATRGKTMGIPLLYPWANRLAGMSYSVAGRTVSLPHDSTRIAFDGNGLPIRASATRPRLLCRSPKPASSTIVALGCSKAPRRRREDATTTPRRRRLEKHITSNNV